VTSHVRGEVSADRSTAWKVTTELVSDTREAKIFGEEIRRLRRERGWTQEDLAEAASLTVVLKLARGFRVSPSELLAPFNPGIMRSLRL
jgi:ribosome-binding protein aMBF1 (putative translation factor)